MRRNWLRKDKPSILPLNDNLGPISGYGAGACITRFLMAFFFGVLLDIFLIFMFARLIANGIALDGQILYVFIALPFLWGIAGIFYLRTMLNAAKKIMEPSHNRYS